MNFSNNTNSFFNSNQFEIINNTFSEEDIIIKRLQREIYQKEQCQKDFAELHSKYEQLEQDMISLNDKKSSIEKELNTLLTEKITTIKDLQTNNDVLIKELNKKEDN